MNFLVHLSLSDFDDEIMFGNFIGDAVKNNDFTTFPEKIQKGILLHRKIDFFADNNEEFKETAKFFSPFYGKYSRVVADIVFDHVLAKNWNKFHTMDFDEFAKKSYEILKQNRTLVPLKFANFVDAFINNDRLKSYLSLEKVKEVLEKMSIYRALPNNHGNFLEIYIRNSAKIEENFFVLYNSLREYLKQ